MRLSVDRPGGLQHVAEGINGFFSGLGEELIGHEYRKFVPYISALGIFILSCNLIGLVPAFESPTATPAVPLGCAICTFLYYHYNGIKANGAGYVKQFTGPLMI